jgi:hypothetical protein
MDGGGNRGRGESLVRVRTDGDAPCTQTTRRDHWALCQRLVQVRGGQGIQLAHQDEAAVIT